MVDLKKRRATLFSILPILLLGVLCYANIFKNEFFFDDFMLIVDNSFVHSWSNLPRLLTPSYLTSREALEFLGIHDIGSGEFTYRPLTTLSYFILHALFGLKPAGWHAFSLLLHLSNAVLVYSLARILFGTKIAFLSSLLFVAHPVHSEAVCGIANINKLLACFFSLASILSHIKNRNKISHIFFGAALFSSESAVITPLLNMLCKKWVLQDQKTFNPNLRFNWRDYIGFFLIIGLYVAVNAWMRQSILPFSDRYFALNFAGQHNLLQKIIIPIKVTGSYLIWLLQPSADYPLMPYFDKINNSHSWRDSYLLLSLCVLAASGVIYRLCRHRAPAVQIGLSWLFIALIPAIGISLTYYACRYLYLPSVGFFMAEAYLLGFNYKNPLLKRYAWIPILAIVVWAVPLTYGNNILFRNNVIFFHSVLESSDKPNKAQCYKALGASYFKYGSPDQALEYYKGALHAKSNDGPYNDLGLCYLQKGSVRTAIHFFNRALIRDPFSVKTWANLGAAYGTRNDYPNAIKYLKKAVTADPSHIEALTNLAITYFKMGDTVQAKATAEKILEIYPGNPTAKSLLESTSSSK